MGDIKRMTVEIIAISSILSIVMIVLYQQGVSELHKHVRSEKEEKTSAHLLNIQIPKSNPVSTNGLTFVSPKAGPAVKMVTYTSAGIPILWNMSKGDDVVRLPVPHNDPFTTHYKREDIRKLRSGLQTIRENLPGRYRMRQTRYLKRFRSLLKPENKKLLDEWLKIVKGSPGWFHNLNQIMYQQDVLLNKIDPVKPWSLKCNGCFMNEYNTTLEPGHACYGRNDIDIFAIVTSMPNSVENRRTIRKTWGSWTKNNTSNIRLIFLFGTGWPKADNELLAKENLQFGDILQEDYHDSYYNLTQKVISGYKWVLRACPRAKFIARTADDTFIDMPQVLGLLETHGSHPSFQNYQIGKCLLNFKPHRWPDFKGYLSTEEYSDHIFPPYAHGTTFITSIDLTKSIVDMSVNVSYVPIEDSYFGLVLREIGSGCLNVVPFAAADDAVSNVKKRQLFKRSSTI